MSGCAGHDFADFFKRATSQLVILQLLTEGPMYGYQISQEIRARSGGKYVITILYPILRRLEQLGYIVQTEEKIVDGRARAYYAITPEGAAHLEKTWGEFQELAQVLHIFMERE